MGWQRTTPEMGNGSEEKPRRVRAGLQDLKMVDDVFSRPVTVGASGRARRTCARSVTTVLQSCARIVACGRGACRAFVRQRRQVKIRKAGILPTATLFVVHKIVQSMRWCVYQNEKKTCSVKSNGQAQGDWYARPRARA